MAALQRGDDAPRPVDQAENADNGQPVADRAAGQFVVDGVEGIHSGMFPCFFGGRASRLLRSLRSASATVHRVAAGSITSVM